MKLTSGLRWGLMLMATVSMSACKNNDVDPNAGVAANKGTADFSRYVAVGNSLTAGYADGGLYRSGQLNSYPNILAGQFKLVGGGDFVQPLFSADSANGSGYLRLTSLPTATNPNPTIVQVLPGAARGGFTVGTSPMPLLRQFFGANQNLGVPGIRMADIQFPGYGSTRGNQYFERLIKDSNKTYLSYVSDNLTNATFFTCWMGNNDALGYAISGGTSPITDATLFQTNYTALINVLTANNRKGVITGIPNVITAPFFNTVTLVQVLGALNNAIKPATPITALVIQSATAPGGVRASKIPVYSSTGQLTSAGDLLLLTGTTEYATIGSTAVGTKNGPYGLSATNPLATQFVLDVDEITTLNNAITNFNSIMKAQADAKNLAYVDPNAVLGQLTPSLAQNGVTYTAQYITGGAFGLDGIHLTPAGYALIANEILRSINAKYGATIPFVNASAYNRVVVQPN